MTEYKETEVESGDARIDVLETLAGGNPWVFVVCRIEPDGDLDLKAEVGGGLRSADGVRSLLEKTLAALPPATKPAEEDPRLGPGGGKTTRFNALWQAMPIDSAGWWTDEEADAFVEQWRRLELPELTMSDGQGGKYFFWCTDVRHAAALIDWSDHVTNDESFSITRGEYEVCIVQAETKGDGNGGA